MPCFFRCCPLPVAPPIKYVLGYRSRTRTLTLTPNPNPITDPKRNPKINKKKTKRHLNEVEHRVISKSRFARDGGGFIRCLQPEREKETHMDIPVF